LFTGNNFGRLWQVIEVEEEEEILKQEKERVTRKKRSSPTTQSSNPSTVGVTIPWSSVIKIIKHVPPLIFSLLRWAVYQGRSTTDTRPWMALRRTTLVWVEPFFIHCCGLVTPSRLLRHLGSMTLFRLGEGRTWLTCTGLWL
jgi:hypothetical protein